MSVIEILICVLVPCVVGLLGWVAGIDRRVKQQEELGDRRDDVLRTAIANLARQAGELGDRYKELGDRYKELDEKLRALDGKIEELPTEEMEAEYRRLEAFNTGVQNILSFGPDVPKLNKDALQRNE